MLLNSVLKVFFLILQKFEAKLPTYNSCGEKKNQDEASSPLKTLMTLVATSIFMSVETNIAFFQSPPPFFLFALYAFTKYFKALLQNNAQDRSLGFPFNLILWLVMLLILGGKLYGSNLS